MTHISLFGRKTLGVEEHTIRHDWAHRTGPDSNLANALFLMINIMCTGLNMGLNFNIKQKQKSTSIFTNAPLCIQNTHAYWITFFKTQASIS